MEGHPWSVWSAKVKVVGSCLPSDTRRYAQSLLAGVCGVPTVHIQAAALYDMRRLNPGQHPLPETYTSQLVKRARCLDDRWHTLPPRTNPTKEICYEPLTVRNSETALPIAVSYRSTLPVSHFFHQLLPGTLDGLSSSPDGQVVWSPSERGHSRPWV